MLTLMDTIDIATRYIQAAVYDIMPTMPEEMGTTRKVGAIITMHYAEDALIHVNYSGSAACTPTSKQIWTFTADPNVSVKLKRILSDMYLRINEVMEAIDMESVDPYTAYFEIHSDPKTARKEFIDVHLDITVYRLSSKKKAFIDHAIMLTADSDQVEDDHEE